MGGSHGLRVRFATAAEGSGSSHSSFTSIVSRRTACADEVDRFEAGGFAVALGAGGLDERVRTAAASVFELRLTAGGLVLPRVRARSSGSSQDVSTSIVSRRAIGARGGGFSGSAERGGGFATAGTAGFVAG